MKRQLPTALQLLRDEQSMHAGDRRGAFFVMGMMSLTLCIMFAAFAVDIGYIGWEQQRMQNGVDAAALSAAMEITYAVEHAGEDVEDVVAYAEGEARSEAATMAALHEIFVDENVDVELGQRYYDSSTQTWKLNWGASPANVVKVTARREDPDVTKPDGRLNLAFAGIFGDGTAQLRAEAIAFVEARDIVTVLDFSRSMNFDSYFASEYEDPASQMPQPEVENNLYKIWEDLGYPALGNMPFQPDWVTIPSVDNSEVEVTWRTTDVDFVANDYDDATDFAEVTLHFSNGASETFTPASGLETFSGTGGNANVRITSVDVSDDGVWETFDFYNNEHIKRGLGLDVVNYPWPVGSWDRYIAMAREGSSGATAYYQYEIYAKGYRRKFGIMTFFHYVLRFESGNWETPDLWMTRHYPFHSVKEGHELFCNFLNDLSFGDQSGLVSYDTNHRVEDTLNIPGAPLVDISTDPITNDYYSLKTIMEYKQAAHYSYATNMGGGLKDSLWLLDNHSRPGSRPTVLLMTDGNTNTMDSGESTSLPVDWDWNVLLDYDGDGVGDYYTDSGQKRYVLRLAKEALDSGYTIHTMSVGADADRALMEAIAWLGNGIWVNVPGNTTVAAMEDDILEAFRRIAAFVPPARLMRDPG